MIDKKRLDDYIYYINSLLKQEDFYDTYMEGINKGQNKYTIDQRFQKKKFDLDWVEAIEDCVVSLDTIVRNPRKFIVIEEDIVDVSLARSITTESVKHLATHTNYIAAVKEDGSVIPSKILNTSKEESFEVYENRFIYTLLLKLSQFINTRFEVVRRSAASSDMFTVNVQSDYAVGKEKVKYSMKTILEMPLDEVLKADPTQLTDVERIARLQNVVSGFMGSPFAKTMVSCALVRPPIVRTNVILKNPDFKKALVLWQFIDSYQQTGYEIKSINETADLPAGNQQKFANLIYLNNLLTESIVRTRTSDEDIHGEEEEKKQEKVQANEYVTKNIDDFVPDDFPELKLSMFETKRLFTHLPEVGEISKADERKINSAIQRCLLQYKINKAKSDSEEQARLMRKLMEEETKAKVAALKAAKEAEKKAAKEKVEAEKRAAREAREAAKLAKEKAKREAEELAERIRAEEEAAMRARIKYEQEEAERRIIEENRRLTAIYEGVKARTEAERRNLKEQLEREKQLQFLEPVEADAMLKLRKKEQQRIRQMRATQEVALRELITAHYQDMERQQQQAILDMEQIADMCDFDIFDDTPVADVAPGAKQNGHPELVEGSPEPSTNPDAPSVSNDTLDSGTDTDSTVILSRDEVPSLHLKGNGPKDPLDGGTDAPAKPRLSTEVEFESDEDIPEMDTSLTTRNAEGENEYARRLIDEENKPDEEEADPTAARSELSSYKPQSYAPADAAAEEDDDDVDIAFSGFDAPIDATAKYSVNYGGAAQSAGQGHLVRPSAVMGVKPSVSQLDDDWDFDGMDELEKKEAARAEAAEAAPLSIKGKTVEPAPAKGKKAAPTMPAGFAVYKPRNTVSATESTIDDILNNTNLVGNVEEEDGGRKKKKDKKRR